MRNLLTQTTLLKTLIYLLLPVCVLTGCFNNDNKGSEKYIYTSTNNASGNEVLQFNIQSSGDLKKPDSYRYSTGGIGDADDGDFDSQGALHIIDNYLLIVNAGEQTGAAYAHGQSSTPGRIASNGSISVMKIDPSNGNLDLEGRTPVSSEGVRPVSITSARIGNTTWVVVANQYDNPLCSTANMPRCATPMASSLRNLVAFTFNRENGELTFISILVGDTEFANGVQGGPSQVEFSPDGKKLAVSTWGVPLLQSNTLSELNALSGYEESYVKVWEVAGMATTLQLSNKREWTQAGVSGSIGFEWSSNNRYLYQTSFSVPNDGNNDFSVVVLDSRPTSSTSSMGALVLTDQSGTRSTTSSTQVGNNSVTVPDQACWARLSPDGRRLYTASFNSNIISFYEVNSNRDKITHKGTYNRKDPAPSSRGGQPDTIPAEDTKDIFMLRDGTFLYVNGAFNSHTMAFYAINGNGTLEEADASPLRAYGDNTPNPANNVQAFLGLVGY